MALKYIIQKFISTLLIVAIITPALLTFFIPKKTNAQWTVTDPGVTATTGTTAAAGTTTAGGTSATAATSAVTAGSAPVSATANTVTATTAVKNWAETVLSNILKVAIKALIAKMVQATINWINSDFHGSPLFIENPQSFFNDIGKSEVRRLVDMVGYDTFRFPFGQQIALNIINSYKRQLADNAQYTLSKVINDPDLMKRYINDYNYGGWNGFLINTQYPQNNYIGFESTMMSQLARQVEGVIQPAAKKVQNVLQQGMGFLSPQTCPSNPSYNNGVNEFSRPSYKPLKYVPYSGPVPDYTDENSDTATIQAYDTKVQEYNANYDQMNEEQKYIWEGKNTCPGGLVNTTPGSVAANQITSAMNMPLLTTALDGALGNSLAAIFDALLNHFMDKGLNALSSTVQPGSATDNWSYNGNTLSGSTTSYGTTTTPTLTIPQNVSLNVGLTTSTKISGGTAPFIIDTKPTANIATAEISTASSSGPTLIITGVGPGQTPVIVKDSSTPTQTILIQVTISAIGALSVVPASISTSSTNTDPVLATVLGGQEPYSIQKGPDQTVAVAAIGDKTLLVSAIAKGTTFVILKDSSTPPKTVKVDIAVSGLNDFIVTPSSVSVEIGHTAKTILSGGTAPYTIENQFNPQIATAQISGSTLTVLGISDGITAVLLKDSSTIPKFANVSISTKPFVPLLASPQNVLLGIGQTSNIPITGGIVPYTIQDQSSSTTSIANAQILSNTPLTLTITGVAPGSTKVTIKDSSPTSPQTFVVDITVNDLTVSPSNVSVNIAGGGNYRSANATISGGIAPYSIQTAPNNAVAYAQISGDVLNIIAGNTRGSTLVIVKDSSTTHTQTFLVNITVN
ncbi:MAG: hypothetical protein WCG28_00965 [bacterium]